MPEWMQAFAAKLQKVFCYCFPPEVKEKPNSAQLYDLNEAESAKNGEKKEQKGPKVSDDTAKACKCDSCDRCTACDKDAKKDKDKAKKKKDIEAKASAWNYLVFIIAVFIMLVGQLSIWLSLST